MAVQEIVPGQEQKLWVQSQTTFASIAKDEEGRPVCRVQKQKIWVEGVSYELQEIYGMEHAAGFRREVRHPSVGRPFRHLPEKFQTPCLKSSKRLACWFNVPKAGLPSILEPVCP